MQRVSSKWVISGGFLSVLLLLSLLIAIAIYTIAHNNQSLHEIVSEQSEVQDVFAMRDAAHKRALLLYRMATLTDVFERDDIFLEFKGQAENFIKARDGLIEKINKQSRQYEAWKQTQPIVMKGSQVQNKTVNLILEDKINAAHELMLNEVIPTQDNVMLGLTKMLESQRSVINTELENVTYKNQTAYLVITVLGIVALLLGSTISVYVFRHNSRSEMLMRQQAELAEQASQAKSSFLANMSHEIRTPLTAIIGFSEILLNPSQNKQDKEQSINSIIRNGKHLHQVINDILDLSKIEAGQLQTEKIATSITDIVDEVKSILLNHATDKGLALLIACEFPLPKLIMSDPIRIKQILINLVSNAIKFTEQGSVTLTVSYDKNDKQLCCHVADTGIGISTNAIEKIFAPFSQADSSTTRKYGGTGLGLCISKQLANMLDGDLICSSTPGMGSQFTLSIHLGAQEITLMTQHDVNQQQVRTNYENTPLLAGNVLLAEDSPDNQRLISMYTERTGASITVVENGEQAVEKGLSGDFDLILMDMQMPVMDGLTAITLLRAAGYTKPIVMLSANAMQTDRDRARQAGAIDYVVKPINVEHFNAVLSRYLTAASSPYFVAPVSDRMQALTQNFLDGLPARLQALNTAFDALDWHQLIDVSHKLKGMGGAFGFPIITTLAEEINLCARQQIEAGLETFIAELNKEADKILQQHAA